MRIDDGDIYIFFMEAYTSVRHGNRKALISVLWPVIDE